MRGRVHTHTHTHTHKHTHTHTHTHARTHAHTRILISPWHLVFYQGRGWGGGEGGGRRGHFHVHLVHCKTSYLWVQFATETDGGNLPVSLPSYCVMIVWREVSGGFRDLILDSDKGIYRTTQLAWSRFKGMRPRLLVGGVLQSVLWTSYVKFLVAVWSSATARLAWPEVIPHVAHRCPATSDKGMCSLSTRGLIHETDLRGKLRPKHEVRNYRRKVAIHESGQREVAT